MSLGLTNLGAAQPTTGLGLSSSSYAPAPVPSYPYAQAPSSSFAGGILGGAGVSQQQYGYGAPMAPPSETEILGAMLQTLQPIDRFIVSQNMPVFIEMLSNLTTYSILNVLKNCTFVVDDEGVMAMEITSLPTDLQTLSPENIIAQLSSLQNVSMQTIQNAENERTQIKAMADQSMMQGMLGAAMNDPGMMEAGGQAIGGMFNRAIFGGS